MLDDNIARAYQKSKRRDSKAKKRKFIGGPHCRLVTYSTLKILLFVKIECKKKNQESLQKLDNTIKQMKEQLGRLYLDTAATATSSMLMPALEMTGKRGEHLVYGSDCGVPCSNERTLNANVERLLAFEGLTVDEKEAIGLRLEKLFPRAAERIGKQRPS